MNRTRKIVLAGIATAVAVVLIALVIGSPSLHTQTPVSTAPPTNGGTDNGGSGATGAGNGTTTSCTASTSNQTGENGDRDGGSETTCGDSTVDHDAMGDRMSSEHRSIEATEHMFLGLEAHAIALAELGATWAATAVHGLSSLTGLFTGLGLAAPA